MSQLPVQSFNIQKLKENVLKDEEDLLAVEEPLEIRIGYGKKEERKQRKVAVTMRTPGMDLELAAGFLFTEGIISSHNDIESIKHCEDVGKEEQGNVVRVELEPHLHVDIKSIERNFYTTSSCGVCGKASIESIRAQQHYPVKESSKLVEVNVLLKLSASVVYEQTVFKHTGGIHAAALFDFSGKLLLLREDVGRHNALDKLIGSQLLNDKKMLNERVLWVSGRSSFELIQKSAMAGIEIMVAVGAPSSLAVQLAIETGITLVGFSRNNSFNLYSHPERIKL